MQSPESDGGPTEPFMLELVVLILDPKSVTGWDLGGGFMTNVPRFWWSAPQ